MTHLQRGDLDLHNPDGTHRTTPASTSGRALVAHERRLRAHLQLHEIVSHETKDEIEDVE